MTDATPSPLTVWYMSDSIVVSWQQHHLNKCEPLLQERNAAEARLSSAEQPKSRRGDMATLQAMPWKTSSINSDKTLQQWIASPENKTGVVDAEPAYTAYMTLLEVIVLAQTR